MGIFFSEGLLLVAAARAMGATHIFESGTAEGQSSELLARFFEGTSVPIVTIDSSSEYGGSLHNKTCRRLRRWPRIDCRLGDSFKLLPALLDALPQQSRAMVFVDGPKGKAGMNLALRALDHAKVALAALHDTAPLWDLRIHRRLASHPATVLLSSHAQYRRIFAPLDAQHDERGIMERAFHAHDEALGTAHAGSKTRHKKGQLVSIRGSHTYYASTRLERLLQEGSGLWIGTRGAASLKRDWT